MISIHILFLKSKNKKGKILHKLTNVKKRKDVSRLGNT